MKNYKIVKEDEDFIWYETSSGLGFVASKHAYFDFMPAGSDFVSWCKEKGYALPYDIWKQDDEKTNIDKDVTFEKNNND